MLHELRWFHFKTGTLALMGGVFLGCATMGTEAHMKLPKGDGSVAKTLRDHRSDFEDCIPQSVSLNSGENLKLSLQVEVSESGSVTQAELRKINLPDPDFSECLCRKLKTLRFPPPQDGEKKILILPLIFTQAKT